MIARLACTLLIVCLSSLYGLSKGHSDIISLDILLEKEPLTDVLKKLESDFDIHFLFKSNLIESVEVEYEIWNVDDEIHDILEDLLDGTDILFKKINKNSYIIVPSKKERILKGHIYGRYDRPLIGATIQSTTNSKGAITNLNGYYELALPSGNHQVEVRHVGYKSETESVDIHPLSDVVIDHHLTESGTLEEIVVLGSKLKPLSVIGSARPIQRVSKTEIERSGFISLTESLNGQVPSFHSTFQTISDGTDHITPSSLRGLGPDQLLVLVNGKRRHHSSLLNINGTTGRGSVSTEKLF